MHRFNADATPAMALARATAACALAAVTAITPLGALAEGTLACNP